MFGVGSCSKDQERKVNEKIPLTGSQRDLLDEFYAEPPVPVFLDKRARNKLWVQFKENRSIPDEQNLIENCPALLMEMRKSIDSGKNVQSAVFSECVYAEALATSFGLSQFADYISRSDWVPSRILSLLKSYALVPRYIYRNPTSSRLLIQAGGNGGVDSALISVIDFKLFSIEFKEPGAKTSEPDLPRYAEDGFLQVDKKFLRKNPQFATMLSEQLEMRLNFWDHVGSNINDFSAESIHQAVTENYSGNKFADVICTEDRAGFLTMVPSNQVHLWGKLEGEIRPGGRNPYSVWTPLKLSNLVAGLGGSIKGNSVAIPKSRVTTSKPRGGSGVGRYRLNSIFFVRSKEVTVKGNLLHFSLDAVKQLRPTIAAKMFFRDLDYAAVRSHYVEQAS